MTIHGAPHFHQAPSSKEFDGIRHDDKGPAALRRAFLEGCGELLLQHGFPFIGDHRGSGPLLCQRGHAPSTMTSPLPSWSRKTNMGGTPSQPRMSSTSTPPAS